MKYHSNQEEQVEGRAPSEAITTPPLKSTPKRGGKRMFTADEHNQAAAAVIVDCVPQDKAGIEVVMSQPTVSRSVDRLIGESRTSPAIMNLVKQGLKNSLYKSAGIGATDILQRLEAGETVPIGTQAVVTGIMTQRAIEMDARPLQADPLHLDQVLSNESGDEE